MNWVKTTRQIVILLLSATLLLSGAARGDIEIAGFNPAQAQRTTIRDILREKRFFDELNQLQTLREYEEADIHEKVEMGLTETTNRYWHSTRHDPITGLISTTIFYGSIAGIIGWNRAYLAKTVTNFNPVVLSSLTSISAIFGTTLLSATVYFIFGAAYAINPPLLSEQPLIYQYGSKKLLLPSSIQQHIENDLFYNYWQTPTADGFSRLERVLDIALRLPLHTKNLDYNETAITEALQNFSPDVINRLKRFAKTEIYLQKMTPQLEGHYPVYFHGPPGTGKTYAVKKLAKAMGTGLTSVILDGASIKDIVGTSSTDINPQPGRLLEAIAHTPSRDTVNHSNKVLFIDEFDRLLTADDKDSRDVLGFMLKLLDPTNRKFYSPFLQTEIRLPDTIILAGNADLQTLARKYPRLEALASRIDSIAFDGFDEQAKRDITENVLIPKLESSYRSLGQELSNSTISDTERDMINAFISQDNDPGLRSLEKYIYTLFEQRLLQP
ncbi:AAA family ATPase [Parendozoicomonas sp. Alg238-R29]|uniref:ATP-binding protein n=1 Tax=Parendozoicomonas sp. Alg238-R29 TaxID=2993446 RepID=UPI00248E8643|nr:AAA family ATPase [Parendozoicomonas sp. Alg238-R29]